MKLIIFTKHIIKKFNSKLINQFLFIYSILMIIPLIILFSYTYTKMSSMIENNIINSTEQAFNQSISFIDYKIDRIFNISNSIVINNNITSVLKKDPSNYPLNEQIKDLNSLRSNIALYLDNIDIYSINLYVNDKFIYSNENKGIYSMSYLNNSKWISKINNSKSRFFWCPYYYLNYNSSDLISLGKTISSSDNYSDCIGYLTINFKEKDLKDILNKINSVDGSICCIINSDGTLISSSNYDLYNSYKDIINETNPSDNTKLKKVTNNKSTIFVQSSYIDNTDWKIVNIVPYRTVNSKINNQRIILIIIVLILGSVSLFAGFYFINSINRRLSKVIKGMRELHADTLNNFIENDSDDELGELINNYNYMISKMSVLIDEQYKCGKAVKNAELKALQSQINPHFLYNTLDMINWMTYKNMNSEIRNAVKKLAKFYKLSLNKGKDIISIDDELHHVSLYTEIQNMRYSNRISLEINVDDSIRKYQIPKITLQPIVENSIVHGILAKGSVKGKILITGTIVQNVIYLKIKDDGIGIKEDELPLILSPDDSNSSSSIFNDITSNNSIPSNSINKDITYDDNIPNKSIHHDTDSNGNITYNIVHNNSSSKGSGYGIRNVNERLKLYYGNEFGLSFASVYGEGTTVTIKLPPLEEYE